GAVLAAQVRQVDLAVIDFQLRGRENGLSLANSLHGSFGIRFILMSHYLTTALTVQAVKLGAETCLDKPVTVDQLLAAIDAVLPKGMFDYLRNDSDRIDRRPFSDVFLPAESSAEVLAAVMLRVCSTQKDPRTNPRLARSGGVSARKFRELCSMCGVKAR